jgi:hypothetical protein
MAQKSRVLSLADCKFESNRTKSKGLTMVKKQPPRAWSDVPACAGADALRGSLMSMNVIPEPLPVGRIERQRILDSLSNDHDVAFVDVSPPASSVLENPPSGPLAEPPLLALCRAVPDKGQRARIVVSRVLAGHVSPQERRWVRAMGFAGCAAEWADEPGSSGLKALVDKVSQLTGMPVPARAQLQPFMQGQDDRKGLEPSPRKLVRSVTGMGAEAFATRLAKQLEITDRMWRLQTFAQCFVARDAVSMLEETLERPRADITRVMLAMRELGLISHVTHDHTFADAELFFRLAWSPRLDSVSLSAVWRTLKSAAPRLMADRTYRGSTYERCFVGQDAVTLLVDKNALSRNDAWLALHRLSQWGLIAHVLHAHPFIDGEYFYRLAGVETASSR